MEKELQNLETVEVSLELMYAFDEAFHQDMPLHEATWSIHIPVPVLQLLPSESFYLPQAEFPPVLLL